MMKVRYRTLSITTGGMMLSLVLALQGRASDCTTTQEQVAALRAQVAALQAKVQRDQEALQRLGFAQTAADVEAWLHLSDHAKEELLHAAWKSVVTVGIDKAVDTAKHGALAMGSWNPPKVNAMINRLRAGGINAPALFNRMRAIANISGKPVFAQQIVTVMEGWKDEAEVADSESAWEAVVTVLGLGLGESPLGLLANSAQFLVTYAYDMTVNAIATARIKQLSTLTDEELRGLQKLSDLLVRHAKEWHRVKQRLAALPDCTDNVSAGADWEYQLQRQRMEAPASQWPALIQQHKEIYRQRGVDPCHSGFFPQGC